MTNEYLIPIAILAGASLSAFGIMLGLRIGHTWLSLSIKSVPPLGPDPLSSPYAPPEPRYTWTVTKTTTIDVAATLDAAYSRISHMADGDDIRKHVSIGITFNSNQEACLNYRSLTALGDIIVNDIKEMIRADAEAAKPVS